MPANFNRIAPYYDALAKMVYGNKLIEAKKTFFHLIPEQAHILLMGGGTGNILNDLLSLKPSAKIDYMEPSHRMLRIAEKNLRADFWTRVNFICGDEHLIPQEVDYDVCTSFFVLDCFTQSHALSFSRQITSTLKPGGLWLFADFFPAENTTHRLLTRAMYGFFRVVSSVETTVIPDYESIFDACGFAAFHKKSLMNDFIRSMALKRK